MTGSAGHATSNNDLLASVLERTGLRGHVYCRSSARGAWGLRFAARPGAVFHAVAAGSCWLSYRSRRIQLVAGDVVLLPRTIAHTLSDAERTPCIDLERWLAKPTDSAGLRTLGARTGPITQVLCGVFEFDAGVVAHPVLDLLPECLHLQPGIQRSDLAGTLASLLGEHERGPLGSGLVIARLLDIMFVQLVRAWVETSAPSTTGWIGAQQDRILSRALGAIHGDPAHAWTVDELAHISGSSRATLARRFREWIGEAPLAYLTRVRLDEAAARLAQHDLGLADVALAVGYASEFAFSRAFRRQHGVAPGQYRARIQAGLRHSSAQ
jgi:AraC-like DNA-binding protein